MYKIYVNNEYYDGYVWEHEYTAKTEEEALEIKEKLITRGYPLCDIKII